MVFQSRSRLIIALLCPVLLASTVSCRRSTPQNEVARRGDDVVAHGSTPIVMDSVPGDAILAGGDVQFSGVAGGDYLGVGGKQLISGRIHGSIRAAGGEIHVAGVVDRNATIAGGHIELDSTGVIARNAYLVGGAIQVNGTVQQSLVVSGGTVSLNGVVGRDVEVKAGELHLGPHTQITGNLRYRVQASKVHIDPAARVSGTTTALPVRGRWGILRVLWLLGFLVAGIFLVALVPRFAADSAQTLRERPGRAALVGLGWIILVPVAICVAAVTIIGLPLALVTAAAYVVLLYVGRFSFAVWLGQQVLGARARTGYEGTIVNFLVGGFLLVVVGIIPLLGSLALAIATILGLGALLLRIQTMREGQPV